MKNEENKLESPELKRLKMQEEANKEFREAKDFLNPWCCFDPDYLSASYHFKQAAEKFMRIEDYQKAILAYDQLAFCDEKIDDLFSASEARKNLMYIYLDKIPNAEKAKLEANECIHLLQVHGKEDRVFNTKLEFARKCRNLNLDELTIYFYKDVIEMGLTEDQYLNARDAFLEYTDFLLNADKLLDALDFYNKHIEFLTKQHQKEPEKNKHISPMMKSYMGIIGIHLMLNEPFIADEKLTEIQRDHTELISSPYFEVACKLVDAANARDQEAFNKAMQTAVMSQLERSLLQKLKKVKLTIPEGKPEKIIQKPSEKNAENFKFLSENNQEQKIEKKAEKPIEKSDPSSKYIISESISFKDAKGEALKKSEIIKTEKIQEKLIEKNLPEPEKTQEKPQENMPEKKPENIPEKEHENIPEKKHENMPEKEHENKKEEDENRFGGIFT